MKNIAIILIIFILGGVTIVLAMGFGGKATRLDKWSVDDEQTVEHLPLCAGGVVPPGDWTYVSPADWPCRIDIVLTAVE